MKRKKRHQKRVNPKGLITRITEVFNTTVSRPKLKNMILSSLAIARTDRFRINEISRHLPVAVVCEKTRQKRLLRFIDSEFPIETVSKKWLSAIISQLYGTKKGDVLILIDETPLIDDYIALVAAVPFRRRAIPIASFIYRNADIQSMKYLSHNTIVQKFVQKVERQVSDALPNDCQPIFIFDRGFDRAQYLIKYFIDHKIRFVIRACQNTGLRVGDQKMTLRQMPTGSYPSIVYQLTQQLSLSLYVVHDDSFDDPMYVISNCVKGLSIYHCYRRRMQIEQGFRDIKTTFGFNALQLKKLEQKRVELLWFLLTLTVGLLMLQYEKSGYRWAAEFNSAQKDKSLIWVIKQVIKQCFTGFQFHPNFTLPVSSSDVATLGLSHCFSHV